MGSILQAPQGAEAVLALLAAAWAGLVVWKSIDYIVSMRRDRAERERTGRGPDGEV